MTQEVSEMCEQLNGLYAEVEGVYQRSLLSRTN